VDECTPLLAGGDEGAATSVPQFLAFREAWLRQVREVLTDGPLFDDCSWGQVNTPCPQTCFNLSLIRSSDTLCD